MTRHRSLSSLLLAAACVLLTACASTTDFVRTSVEDKPQKPATTLLIAGVTTDDAVRRRYEETFLAELARAGLSGVASSSIIPSLSGLTMPQIREQMLRAGDRADAVLHVQLMDLFVAPALAPTDLPPDAPSATRTVGGVAVSINAPATDQAGQVTEIELEANLYELPGRRLLWTAITRTHEANAIEKVARSHARALIARMQAEGLLAAGR